MRRHPSHTGAPAGACQAAGPAWIEQRVVELHAWDGGTDSGDSFTSPDEATVPRQAISLISTAPLAPDGQRRPLGTFTFTRLSTAALSRSAQSGF